MGGGSSSIFSRCKVSYFLVEFNLDLLSGLSVILQPGHHLLQTRPNYKTSSKSWSFLNNAWQSQTFIAWPQKVMVCIRVHYFVSVFAIFHLYPTTRMCAVNMSVCLCVYHQNALGGEIDHAKYIQIFMEGLDGGWMWASVAQKPKAKSSQTSCWYI